jgi:hypothetical protein
MACSGPHSFDAPLHHGEGGRIIQRDMESEKRNLRTERVRTLDKIEQGKLKNDTKYKIYKYALKILDVLNPCKDLGQATLTE